MKLLYIGDAEPEQTFLESMRTGNIEVSAHFKSLGRLTGRNHFYRHLQYLRLALYGLRRRKEHDAVFIWQQYIGIYYYLLSLLYPRYKRPAVLFYVIYKKPENRIFHAIKKALFTCAIRSSTFARVVFMNKNDYLFKKAAGAKKAFVNFCRQPSDFIEANYGRMPVADHYFSGGVSNRKYRDLLEVARCDRSFHAAIAATEKEKSALKDIPGNINFITGAYGKDFEKLLLQSKAVIIPLDDPMVISGQLVVLSALQAGKVVIITKNEFLDDWLGGYGDNEFIHTYQEVRGLKQILHSLDDEKLREGGSKAREFYTETISKEKMYKELTDIVLTLNSKQATAYPQ